MSQTDEPAVKRAFRRCIDLPDAIESNRGVIKSSRGVTVVDGATSDD